MDPGDVAPAVVVHASDEVLVRGARAGDTRAFEELVKRWREPIYRVALRVLGNPADAEDVAQETFVRAWRGLASFRGEAGFGTWLYTIATRRALSAAAARTLRAEPREELPEAVHHDAPDVRAELRATLRALAALPYEQRALVVLRELEGLSYREIAAVLALPEAKVKGRLNRARARLAALACRR